MLKRVKKDALYEGESLNNHTVGCGSSDGLNIINETIQGKHSVEASFHVELTVKDYSELVNKNRLLGGRAETGNHYMINKKN